MSSNFLIDDSVLPPGEVIDGKYEIISKIGQGGMGVVYKARDTIKREVALKMLTHVDSETRQRFLQEAATLGQITHRAVVRVDDFGEDPKCGPYLAMEYVRGWDLASYARKNSVSTQEAVDLTLAICAGVQACHDSSITHRDLKPNNVRVSTASDWEDRVKILDFGLAIPFDSPILQAYQTRITQTGAIHGTPRYIAPELLRRMPATQRSDQYAIASLFYLLLAGRDPYPDLDGDQLLHAILRGRYTSLSTLRPDLPPVLLAAAARGLQVDPEKRFPSVDALADAILSESSPKFLKGWTKYFRGRKPVDRRLIGAVSGPHRNGMVEQLRPRVIAPMPEPPPPVRSPVFALPPPLPSPPPSPTPPSSPDPPEYKVPSARHSPRQRTHEMSTLITFVCGAAFGATIATLAFLVFLIAESHAAFCPTPALLPAPQSNSQQAHPTSP
jgi:serine/threonine protein kinase